MRENECPVNFI